MWPYLQHRQGWPGSRGTWGFWPPLTDHHKEPVHSRALISLKEVSCVLEMQSKYRIWMTQSSSDLTSVELPEFLLIAIRWGIRGAPCYSGRPLHPYGSNRVTTSNVQADDLVINPTEFELATSSVFRRPSAAKEKDDWLLQFPKAQVQTENTFLETDNLDLPEIN